MASNKLHEIVGAWLQLFCSVQLSKKFLHEINAKHLDHHHFIYNTAVKMKKTKAIGK